MHHHECDVGSAVNESHLIKCIMLVVGLYYRKLLLIWWMFNTRFQKKNKHKNTDTILELN